MLTLTKNNMKTVSIKLFGRTSSKFIKALLPAGAVLGGLFALVISSCSSNCERKWMDKMNSILYKHPDCPLFGL